MNERKFALVRFTPAAIVKHDANDEQVPEVMPLADIVETTDAFIVTMDLPGVAKESIRLNVGGGELSVNASVRRPSLKNAAVVYREITPKQYRRQFRLGNGVDHEHIDAQYADGVLTIALPKTDALKLREIIIH
jgi:HSP20 family protein